MIASHVLTLVVCTWIALGLIWVAGMLSTKRTVRSQSVGSRSVHLLFVLPGYALLGYHQFGIGWLGERFVPATSAVALTGLAITVAGCAFAAWARITLGGNWSGRVTLKQGHELITTGPYALARHPIYAGLITAVAGTALAIGEWRCAIALVLVAVGFITKIRQEEQLMLETFPDAYPAYRERVKALIPGIC
jgi:protein-S-isoprenylcysteine O-methyltransferase Ste14